MNIIIMFYLTSDGTILTYSLKLYIAICLAASIGDNESTFTNFG